VNERNTPPQSLEDGEKPSPTPDGSGFFELVPEVNHLEVEQSARMAALLEVTRRMNATLDEEELLPFMMGKVVELMEADHGHLVLLLPAEGGAEPGPDYAPWEVKVTISRDENDQKKASPPSNTMIRRVVDTRQPMRLDDALSDDLIKDSKSAHELGLRSVMAVPLITRSRLLGVLSVENRGKFAQFNEEHLDFLQVFGNQAAVAIENARLYRSLRDAQAQLSRAHRAMRLEVHESHQALKSERQRLEVLESEVRHLDKMAALGMMVSGIAHELNNPLTGALGFAQLLALSTNLTEKQQGQLGHITTEMSRCAEIIRNLLRFSRKSKFQRARVDLNQLVRDAVDLRRYQMEVNNVVISESFDTRIGEIMIDHFQLKGVFLNLLNNAFDAIQTHQGKGQITVTTTLTDDDRLQVTVSDTGGGILDLEKIFDPFYTTKEVGKGTGLGMSVAFGVVRAHGGTITAQNIEGGACVSVELPHERPPEEEIAPPLVEEPTPTPAISAGRILVIDDEEVIRELCEALLEGEGFQVDLAADGVEGKAKIEANQYDLIITDIRMPGNVSGVDLYRWLRKRKPEMCDRVIFITGDLLTRNLRDALGEVGRRLLTKPFPVATLIEVVRGTLAETQG